MYTYICLLYVYIYIYFNVYLTINYVIMFLFNQQFAVYILFLDFAKYVV